MGFSDYFEGVVLDYLIGAGSDGPPEANWYVGLMTAAPTDAGGGTEVATGSYARVAVAVTDLTRVASAISNDNDITFPAPTANWGTVTHVAIYDASTVGNLLFWAVLVAPRVINNGDPAPKFPAGTLVFTLD